MLNNWKKVTHSRNDSWKPAIVSLSPRGRLALNASAWRLVGSPEAVEVLFDQTNNCIGLQPTSIVNRDHYRVAAHRSARCYVIRIHRVLEEFRIKLPATVRFYDMEVDRDGILVLDLRTARIPPIVTNHWATKRKGEKA